MSIADLPEGWQQQWDRNPTYVTDGRTLVEVDDDHLRIDWTEGADDHYGSASRSVEIPTALVRALLSRLDGNDEVTP